MSLYETYLTDHNRLFSDAVLDPYISGYIEPSDIQTVKKDLGDGMMAQEQMLVVASIEKITDRILSDLNKKIEETTKGAGKSLRRRVCEDFKYCDRREGTLAQKLKKLEEFLRDDLGQAVVVAIGWLDSNASWAIFLCLAALAKKFDKICECEKKEARMPAM